MGSADGTLPALPILYLPGAGGRSVGLRPIADLLAPRRPPLLVDYPGLGDAPADPSLQTLEDLADRILSGLPGTVDVVAKSMGARLALGLALEHPSRFRRLVLLAPSGGMDLRALGGLDWRPTFLELRPTAPRWFVHDRTDYSPVLSRLGAPILVVTGGADLIAPPLVGEYLAGLLPGSRHVDLPGATHDLETEEPEVIASLIEEHLRGRGDRAH